jgi:hypothetical protein
LAKDPDDYGANIVSLQDCDERSSDGMAEGQSLWRMICVDFFRNKEKVSCIMEISICPSPSKESAVIT